MAASTSDLIQYIAAKLADLEASVSKTKLVKLLYLVDVENYRRTRHLATHLPWRFYHYGPYALEIDELLQQLHLDLPEEEVRTAAGHRAFTYRANAWQLDELERRIPSDLRAVGDRVLSRWALEGLNQILDYVYFHTEPMKSARRGDALDFSTIEPLRYEAQREISLPDESLKDLRHRFNEARERLRLRPRRIDPPPRFDKTFQEGVRLLAAEEAFVVPEGNVELDDEAKEGIRKTGA